MVVFYLSERGLTLLIEPICSIFFSLLLEFSFKAQIYSGYIINVKVKDSSFLSNPSMTVCYQLVCKLDSGFVYQSKYF